MSYTTRGVGKVTIDGKEIGEIKEFSIEVGKDTILDVDITTLSAVADVAGLERFADTLLLDLMEPGTELVSTDLVIRTMARGTGKTEKIIKWILEDPDNRCVLCASHAALQHYVDFLVKAGLPHLQAERCTRIITAKAPMGFMREYAIDDIERFLADLVGSEPSFITTSAELEWG